jgi:hypothetical protein
VTPSPNRSAGFGPSRPAAQRGQFQSYTDANGVTMAVTSYTADGHIAETQRSATSNGQTTTESWLYGYVASGVNTGLLASVTLRTKLNGGAWGTVRQVQYSYYDGTQTYGGNPGDLLSATVLDANNNVLQTSYYRYYVSGQANGYAHALELVFNPDSYDWLTAALGTNVASLTDSQVAPYADNYFQYDSLKRVTLETAQGAGALPKTVGVAWSGSVPCRVVGDRFVSLRRGGVPGPRETNFHKPLSFLDLGRQSSSPPSASPAQRGERGHGVADCWVRPRPRNGVFGQSRGQATRRAAAGWAPTPSATPPAATCPASTAGAPGRW